MGDLINDGRPFLLRTHADAGLSRREVVSLGRDGRLRRILDRVYVDALAPDTRSLRLGAIGLVAPPQAVVADEWAAWVHGVDTFSPAQRHQLTPTLLVPHGQGRSRVAGVRCRQGVMAKASDVEQLDGVLVTTPLRTVADAMRKRWRPHAMAAADAMARAGLVTADDVWEYLGSLVGYPGIRQARSLAPWIDPLSQSAGESWTKLRLVDAGFPRPVAQWPVVDVDGVQRYVDLAYPSLRLGVEYDGREFHTGADDVAADEWRARALRARGVRLVVADRARVLGTDDPVEVEVGRLLGLEPLARRW